MTIAESYREYKGGKINKQQFMERARKDHHLKGLVTNVMSFQDTVRVLKNKGIISEALEAPGVSFQDPQFKKIAIPVMNDMLDDCMSNYDGDFENWVENGMSHPPMNVQQGLERLEQMSSPEEVEKFIQAAYKKIQQHCAGGVNEVGATKFTDRSPRSKVQTRANVVNRFRKAATSAETEEEYKALADMYKKLIDKERKSNISPREIEQILIKLGKFDTVVDMVTGKGFTPPAPASKAPERSEMNPELADLLKKKDELFFKLLAGELTKAQYKKQIGDIPQRIKAFYNPVWAKQQGLREGVEIIPAELRKGINFELGLIFQAIPDWDDSFVSPDQMKKAENKALKNLEKDSLYYTKLIATGEKPKKDEPEMEIEYKESNVSDTTNKTKGDGFLKKELKKDEDSNVQTSLGKSEAKSGKPEGVKQLKEGLHGRFDSDDNTYTYDHLINTDSPDQAQLKKVLDAIKADRETLAKGGKKVKYVKGDTVPYLELIEVKQMKEAFMPGVDLGASFEKMKGSMGAEEEFEKLMKDYDWYHEMSDDPSKWEKGQEVEMRLKDLADIIGPEKAVQIYNKYAPQGDQGFSRQVSTTHFAKEGKIAKLKETLKKKVKEALYRDKKTKKLQSFDPKDPAVEDPDFRKYFEKP